MSGIGNSQPTRSNEKMSAQAERLRSATADNLARTRHPLGETRLNRAAFEFTRTSSDFALPAAKPTTAPARPLSDVIMTDALFCRPARPIRQDGKRRVEDLAALMVDRPDEVLPRFVDLALELCDCVAAGLSLYEPGPSGGVFRWRHLRGMLQRFEGTTTPRHFSPCGVTLDCHAPTLYAYPERHYTWIADSGLTIPEVLLVPLYLGNDSPFGTLWVVADRAEHFNACHAKALVEIASFVSVALRPARATGPSASSSQTCALLRKLASHESLDAADQAAILTAATHRRAVKRGERIVARAGKTIAVEAGFVGECRTFEDGHVQIVRLHVAGDLLPSVEEAVLDLEALCDAEVTEWPMPALATVVQARPAIARAINCARVMGDAVFYRWVAALGGRPAQTKMAHLLCELYSRLRDVDRATEEGFALPLSQMQLASICGLSLVHTNKTLRNGLADAVRLKNGRVQIFDLARLQHLAEFDLPGDVAKFDISKRLEDESV